MINSKSDLSEFLKLDIYASKHPAAPRGSGQHVAEIDKTYSWPAIFEAVENLTNDQLKSALAFQEPISFHNNSNTGHGSVGAQWTLQYFLEYNGTQNIQSRIKNLLG